MKRHLGMRNMVLPCLVILCVGAMGCGSKSKHAPSDDAGTEDASGLPVGSACTASHECSGPSPDCIAERLAPLSSFETSENPVALNLAQTVVIPLPDGYCSNEAPCASDADCGDLGTCFLPLIDVDEAEYTELVNALSLDSEDASTLIGFREYGQCLRPCETAQDCPRPGYQCAVPLEDFLVLVEGIGARMETYCIGDALDPCVPNPCVNGTCQPSGGTGFVCTCDQGWVGLLCDQPDPCLPSPCQNGGTCSVEDGEVLCTDCDPGWMGPLCDVPDPCVPNPCQNGTCQQEPVGTFQCHCDQGWSGALCDTPHDCGHPGPVTAPLQLDLSGGTTLGSLASYSCEGGYFLSGDATRTCGPTGWSGDEPTCVAQPLQCEADTCSGNGTCVEVGGEFAHCDCHPGWTGPFCATVVDCGAPASAPAHGSLDYTATTYGSLAIYSCEQGYTLVGNATVTCGESGAWSDGAPVCEMYSCDVVYSFVGQFRISDAPMACGNTTNQVETNASNPAMEGGATTPFTVTSVFQQAYLRLRFPESGGNPVTGHVQLIEYYLPLEFVTDCTGAFVTTDVDHSLGLLAMSGAPPQIPASPSVHRPCVGWATGVLAGTTLDWSACDVVPPATGNNWSHALAQAGPGDETTACAMRMSVWGHVGCTGWACGFVSNLGNQRNTWDQLLLSFTFSGTNYRTATFSMPEVQLPESTSDTSTRTWLSILSATPVHVECGAVSTLTCDEQ